MLVECNLCLFGYFSKCEHWMESSIFLRVYCIKTAERIIEILSPSDRPIILVFRHQGSLRKSDGFTPNGGAKYKGVAIFDQYEAISRKR